jgi:hypothetical protein
VVAEVGRLEGAPGDVEVRVRGARLPRLLDAVTGLGAAASLACVLWRIGDGFDLTDEASYVQAADPPERGDAFNGFFGLYLRPLWQLCGWNIAAVRVVGVLVLAGAAVVLGVAAAPLAGRPVAS